MRASRRAIVLGFVLAVCAPGAASASPMLGGSGGSDCTFGLVTLANCSLFALDPFSPDPLREGTFDTAGDLAIFSFHFDEASRLSVSTSSYADGSFDPQLGLFRADGTLLELADGTAARFFDNNLDAFDYDDHIDLELGQGSYFMALAVAGLRDSLFAGSDCDSLCDFPGIAFSFEVSADPVGGNTDPVPEPATVTLVAGGALAGWLPRRRARTRARAARISR